MNPEPITLVKDVVPKRDYFQAQFLLLVAPGGLTNVVVDTSLVDFEGRVWSTGPRAQLSVKVFDDPSASSKSQAPSTHGVPGSSRQGLGIIPSISGVGVIPSSTAGPIGQPPRY
jgi:hypothetical protein